MRTCGEVILTTANNKKQKLIIQDLLSSPDIYLRTSGILMPSYFDPEYEPIVQFIHDYYSKYKATPAIDILDAEFDADLVETKKVTRDRIESTCDEVEKFCRETAVKDAIYESMDDVSNNEMSKVLDRITQAVQISLQRDMGVDVFHEPEERLISLIEDFTPIPTGIAGIDGPLDGGMIRSQFTLLSANSGGGKSLMMANIGRNYAMQGLDVLYISLELKAEMVFLRLAAILSGYDAALWKSHIPEIAAKILDSKAKANGGSYILKRLKQHTTGADIRSYLSYYEMEYGKMPDVLLIDYLDLMDPNAGIVGMGIFDQDKRKSEEVLDILVEYDMIGISASQQNRDALSVDTPNQAVIAGGISKVNTVDNYISLYMSDTMKLKGEMNAYFLKTRSSRGDGHCSVLDFNPINLRIGDPNGGAQTTVMPTGRKEAKTVSEIMTESTEVTVDVKDLPGVEYTSENITVDNGDLLDSMDDQTFMHNTKVTPASANELMNLMSGLN